MGPGVDRLVQVTVRAFATVRELLGTRLLHLDLPAGATLADLVDHLVATTPHAATLKDWLSTGHLNLARNLVHSPPETPLSDGDEVALFPPVTGG